MQKDNVFDPDRMVFFGCMCGALFLVVFSW
ncbi:MAG: hypothetical protein DID92_2727744120 [Candidatus Nitrotoga sp. SPKER]|nr:MAG: hypothetical protein DID92_2727744120 [Candidatus Nitrotoga sp. SPKER]